MVQLSQVVMILRKTKSNLSEPPLISHCSHMHHTVKPVQAPQPYCIDSITAMESKVPVMCLQLSLFSL